MPIHPLSPEVVSQIAAGEVVERPASVVKELVENSLDAGASSIGIETKGGGVSFIKVVDDGIGIPSDEVELAFHRYATSKIDSLADLGRTSSLGFRGEALPSIAAVAQVEVLTRTAEEGAGTWLYLENGQVVKKGIKGCPQGATLIVKNLFRRVPARLKFLKSTATEDSHIAELVSQYSLAFPEVRFTLVMNGRRVLQTSGKGSLRDALVEVYGLEVAQAMLEIEARGEGFAKVSGFVSPPPISRTSRSYLSFFVNRRWVQSRLLARAVEKAYEGLLMSGRYPIVVLNISLSPEEVDVNVHPTKREVRFHKENALFTAVYEAVERELKRQKRMPELKLYPVPSLETRQPLQTGLSISPSEIAPPSRLILRVLGQLASTYIIAEGEDGLYLIDQHAAHERVLYERALAQLSQRKVEVQGLLEPLTIELDARQKGLLDSQRGILAQFGFDIEPFGGRTYLVRAVPTMLGKEKIEEAVKEMVDNLGEEASSTKREEKVAVSLACHSAVRAGQVLSPEETRELIRQLEETSSPRTCPHGRPTMIHLSSEQLGKQFGRI